MTAKVPRLRQGDLVALEAPAGFVDGGRIEGAVRLIQSRGFRVALFRDLAKRERYFAGTDTERLAGLQAALDDEEVKAVFLARGGYGSQRIAPLLRKPSCGPKPVAGFSDNTALLGFLGREFGWPTLHAPHPREDCPAEFDELLACLADGALPTFAGLKTHSLCSDVTAPVAGGCLSILSATVATACHPVLAGKIVFIEDVAEPPYRVDRMLTHLLQAGSLERSLAVVFGRLESFGPVGADMGEMEAVIDDFAAKCAIPVLSGLSAGHVEPNMPLPFGPLAQLHCAEGKLEFLEPAAG